jgi:hypothetical protein
LDAGLGEEKADKASEAEIDEIKEPEVTLTVKKKKPRVMKKLVIHAAESSAPPIITDPLEEI